MPKTIIIKKTKSSDVLKFSFTETLKALLRDVLDSWVHWLGFADTDAKEV